MSARRDRITAILLLLGGVCALVASAGFSLIGGISTEPLSRPGPADAGKGGAGVLERSASPKRIVPRPSPPTDPRDAYDVQHYLLDLWPDLDHQVIGPRVTARSAVVDPLLDTMVFDLMANMTVDPVEPGGPPLPLDHPWS